MSKYNEYKHLNLPLIAEEVAKSWDEQKIFEKSVSEREGAPQFVFYEGPPSANGMPGIHHVMGRTIKDVFCRYKTQKGFQVKRKAGWDTHGLPVELGVEKELGITKEDIGTKISIEAYNEACKKAVMKYTDVWNNLTKQMGYWVDMEEPYVTYKSKYMESVWWLLNKLYEKDLIYKGYTIQPYSPKAGTGLSSHEINQPGCYQDVKDTTVTAQFAIKEAGINRIKALLGDTAVNDVIHFIAWTTTPWTLPSNTALAVGNKIDYCIVNSYNQYTYKPITVILASALVAKHFPVANEALELEAYQEGDKKIPFEIVGTIKGADLVGMRYEQLLPYCLPYQDAENAFKVIPGDFVTTADGTGIVHIAPTFGADDALVAKAAGIPPMLVLDDNDSPVPLVDLQGKFTKHVGNLAGKYVKNEYYDEGQAPERSIDVEIAILLKEENKAFLVAKYEHSYPHCWRTDKPILYYPLDSWFIKTTAKKERMQELNHTINWQPERTGSGRFGEWLKNLNDWNLSRSRYWGIPIPIWRTEDGSESICIGSAEQLKKECAKAVAAGVMNENPLAQFEVGDMSEENYAKIDLHKDYMDRITLVASDGRPMKREADLIDVWFDSGSMPYAQLHYPFEHKELIDDRTYFPANFIAEGVDQTRGWFYTLHAIATMCFDSVAYKSVMSNGLVLDKHGKKMSKRLGNGVDPFITLDKYGPDATRWYMITNAQPWDDLKFDLEGITEVQRKFFGTLYNTYAFFVLYANLDEFKYKEDEIAFADRAEIDRWVLSRLNSLIETVEESYEHLEPTKAGRIIQQFVVDHLSNWYVRLCRRRFWKGEYSADKISAYQTLYTCMMTVAKLSAPLAPFFSDRLYNDLNKVSGKETHESIHLSSFPAADPMLIDKDLESRMEIAQKVCSMALGLRKKERIKVRQPLSKIMIPILNNKFKVQLQAVEALILSEINVKELEYLEDTAGVLVKRIKPNFKTLGPKYGKHMKGIAAKINAFNQEDIAAFERCGGCQINLDGEILDLTAEHADISTDDVPGWLVNSEGGITVAMDITLTSELKSEGIAREFVNRIQNMRKEQGLDVSDKINLLIQKHDSIDGAINDNLNYICSETLANSLELVDKVKPEHGLLVEVEEGVETLISIDKLN